MQLARDYLNHVPKSEQHAILDDTTLDSPYNPVRDSLSTLATNTVGLMQAIVSAKDNNARNSRRQIQLILLWETRNRDSREASLHVAIL